MTVAYDVNYREQWDQECLTQGVGQVGIGGR